MKPDAPSMRIESYGSCLGLNVKSLGLRDLPVVPKRVKAKGEKRPLPSQTTRHLFLTYRLLPPKTETSHKKLAHNQAFCSVCHRTTAHRLVSGPVEESQRRQGAPLTMPISKSVNGKVTVTHVPEILAPLPAETAEPLAVPGEEEKWPEEATGATGLSPDAWADIYKMPSEAVSLALSAPQLQFSDETSRLQGVRISRFCIRHNIALPPYLDAVPIAGRALSDYAILFAKMKARKTGKAPGATGDSAETGEPEGPPEEAKIPESSVEHVSSEIPLDIDERLKQATTYRKR